MFSKEFREDMAALAVLLREVWRRKFVPWWIWATLSLLFFLLAIDAAIKAAGA